MGLRQGRMFGMLVGSVFPVSARGAGGGHGA